MVDRGEGVFGVGEGMRGWIGGKHDGFDRLLKDGWDVEGVAHKNDSVPQDVIIKSATIRLGVVECWVIDLFVITSRLSIMVEGNAHAQSFGF